ncbi:uncharacterized protein EDB93DRAFT_1110015 [Suillus bovinus]|uniref:uncharacterized protein n=1 Tax=Suillus bovinus TaxID=48563 RepID=UPI001B8684D8|nr:uncharacterized protein EDB93DRAFT_1110015 [Suillus bovinus]KAG2125771.1 hypothetical protein EDB93DRAFT_1110015 [Suillus bovinus]
MVIFCNATKNYENILGDPQSRETAPNYWMMIATGHYRVFKHKVLRTCNNVVQMSENVHGNNYTPSEASSDGQDTGWTSAREVRSADAMSEGPMRQIQYGVARTCAKVHRTYAHMFWVLICPLEDVGALGPPWTLTSN